MASKCCSRPRSLNDMWSTTSSKRPALEGTRESGLSTFSSDDTNVGESTVSTESSSTSISWSADLQYVLQSVAPMIQLHLFNLQAGISWRVYLSMVETL